MSSLSPSFLACHRVSTEFRSLSPSFLAHLELFGRAITPMTKTTFYFVIGVLVVTDVVQARYRRKLLRMKEAGTAGA